jgi:cytochrome b
VALAAARLHMLRREQRKLREAIVQRVQVWDLPTRVMHWVLAFSVAGAAGLAFLTDDDGPWFRIHMLLGLMAGFVVVLRIVWGIWGTKYARFGSFAFGPKALVAYVRGVLRRGPEERHVGHNPGSSYAIWALLGLPLALVATGLLMSVGGEVFEEVHEPLAIALLVFIGAHLAGIVWHTVRHREGIALGMVDGRKLAEPSAAIPSTQPGAGLFVLALCAAWAGMLATGYDSSAGVLRLPFGGGALQLGEDEEEEEEHEERDGERGEREGTRRAGHDDRHEGKGRDDDD